MRQGQQNKRMRGRNRKGPNPLTRSFESNGPDVKIRGTALHIAEKYVQLARDAQSSGDRVAAENYLQHAEHYYRIVAAAQAQMPQPQQVFRNDDEEGDEEDDRFSSYSERGYGDRPAPYPQQGGGQPSYGSPEQPQPYVNGNGNGNGAGAPRAEGEEAAGAPEDNRPQEGQNREHREYREGGGGFRGRRRRPYRDRFGGQDQNEPRGDAPYQGNPAPAPAGPTED
jgi:hypothetical protein